MKKGKYKPDVPQKHKPTDGIKVKVLSYFARNPGSDYDLAGFELGIAPELVKAIREPNRKRGGR